MSYENENLSISSGDLMGLANFTHRQAPCRNLVGLRSLSIVHACMSLAMGIFGVRQMAIVFVFLLKYRKRLDQDSNPGLPCAGGAP